MCPHTAPLRPGSAGTPAGLPPWGPPSPKASYGVPPSGGSEALTPPPPWNRQHPYQLPSPSPLLPMNQLATRFQSATNDAARSQANAAPTLSQVGRDVPQPGRDVPLGRPRPAPAGRSGARSLPARPKATTLLDAKPRSGGHGRLRTAQRTVPTHQDPLPTRHSQDPVQGPSARGFRFEAI